MSRALCIILAFLLMPIVGQAQEEKIKVKLDVSADEIIKPQVLSYMRNALRGIRDVDMVDELYYYELQVVVLRNSTAFYSLSGMVLQQVPHNIVMRVFGAALWNIWLNDRSIHEVLDYGTYKKIYKTIEEDTSQENFSKKLSIARTHFLHTDSSLKDLCERAVATFDNSVLEENRNFPKTLKKYNEEQQVRWTQTELNKASFYDGPMDGIMGTKTRNAIKQYQESKGLPVTGEADKPTLDTLYSDANRKIDEKYNKEMEELKKRQKP